MISGTFPPRRFGGVTAVSYNHAKRLVKRGHEVTVYTTDVGNDWRSRLDVRDTEIIDGINVYYFRNISNSLAFKHRIHLPMGMIMATRKEIRSFDIIHLHDLRIYQNIIVHHYAKKYNIPYVLQAHGSVLPIIQKQQLKKIFDLIFGYRILKGASKAIAVAKTEVEQYKKMGVDEDKIDIVPNGIELSEYENLPERGEFRRKYSIRDNEKIVLYLGRLHKTKGIELLVKSFSDYRLTLEEIIQALKMDNKVLFTGFVSTEEKMAALVDADVFVTPSFSGFPITFLEACACSVPLITTNNGDKFDWIHDKVGYVVEYDKDQLRDAIMKVLSDEGLKRRFGEEGRRLVREEFGWGKIVLNVEKIYSNLMKK
jgi:glycosyltransferase involved in cell wall biosynthesis